MNKYEVIIKITLSDLSQAINVYRDANRLFWYMEVDPEQVEAQCTLNGKEFFTINEHGQRLTIDDHAFGVGG